MNKLNTIRQEIDKIDQEMLELFEKRMNLVEEVILIKQENNILIDDYNREEEMIKKNITYLKEKKYEKSYKSFLESVICVSKNYQSEILKKG